MNTKKRILALLLMAAAIMSIFAGCGKPADSAQDKNTDSVVIAITTEPETLDPCMGWGHGNMPLLQSTLVKYDYDMSFKNDLATGYTLSEDGLTWTFTLRDDAYFTDGEKLTASDVVFTFNTAKNAKASVDLTFMEKIEAPNDTTVVVTLTKPTSVFLNTVASLGIVPEHAYGPDYGVDPIGSGPFKFVQWSKQEQLILEANENYYGTVPAMKKVTIVFMSEDAALAAVKAGQVDIAQSAATLADIPVAGYNVKRISSVDNRGFTLPMSPDEGKTTEGGYPIGNNVTCNIEVRHAIAYALDREMVANVALSGYATPCYSENDGMPWNNPEVKIETNVEYAKKLLADAGWADTDGDGIVEKDGIKAEFGCVYPSGDSVRQAVAMAAAEQLKEIGISVIVEGTSWDDISKRMFSESVMMGWGAANPYESYCLYQSAGAFKDDYYNPEGYMSETTDAYLAAAMEALTVEEAYRNWQLAQWDGETGTAMKGECPWVWIVNIDHIYFARDGLDIGAQQLHPHGASLPILQNLQDWKWVN
ncbi:MAG: ABC transporter substrate-binding protein [Clostridia bacterium]|nr:ABC transporter substrate-binding protein [Clostridia bacterium]MBR6654299.1 ABC transporter substrate-binding protein [Oscillospiraceae bacterium]